MAPLPDGHLRSGSLKYATLVGLHKAVVVYYTSKLFAFAEVGMDYIPESTMGRAAPAQEMILRRR